MAGADRRAELEALVDDLRPRLHRYAARLIGSVIDGEDVVQDTCARALAALDELPDGTPLQPWLFRIAHNRAIDFIRQDRRHREEPVDLAADLADEDAADPEDAILRREAVTFAVSRFTALPVSQRAVVVLKDVLEEPLADIAALLDLTVDAVKAHLARGRARLRDSRPSAVAPGPILSAEAQQFAALFNQRDWAALRALLAADVRLNQARRPIRHGIADVGMFFSFYEAYPPVRLEPAWLDGREVFLVFEEGALEPRYFMRLAWAEGRITEIRDHRYAGYVMEGAGVAAPA